MLTKTHIIIVGSDGSMEWMALPTDPGGELQVCLSDRISSLSLDCQLNRRVTGHIYAWVPRRQFWRKNRDRAALQRM